MKSIIKLSKLFLLIIFLTSCSLVKLNNYDMAAPSPGELKIWKYWKYDRAYSLTNKSKMEDDSYYKNLTAIIERDRVLVGNDVLIKPSIKVTYVNSYDYFLNKYRQNPEDIGVTNEYFDVYSITDKKGYSLRLFKLSDDKIAIERNNILIFFNRSEKFTDSLENIPGTNDGESYKNGLLLSLRKERTVKDEIFTSSQYRTFWIFSDREGNIKYKELKDIILPRDSFYRVKVIREENIDVIVEYLVLENLSTGEIVKETSPGKMISRFEDISFISEDYVSLVTRLNNSKKEGLFQFYETKHIENLSLGSNSLIGDLFGPEGTNIYNEGATAAIADNEDFKSIKSPIDYSSFKIERQNGRWVYKGRINYPDINSEKYVDFPLALRDNFRVYKYDNLEPQWARIKVLVPEAEDAVSSPENFFTLVKTENQLQVFLKNSQGEMENSPKLVIDIDPLEKIVMHEWAVGNTVDDWDKLLNNLDK